ncbi:hypothetical protein [Streptomyces sp. ACT015]|uniref:hypothetical protein n=1 Tax=Streptomyces sp. ACT015 TaxID=3134807 RepID=UPI003D186781
MTSTPVRECGPAATLHDVGRVPWHDLRDATGSAAAIPLLLAAIASGDDAAARTGVDRLRHRICQYGFVVVEATPVTVPFLWHLAQRPQVTCRSQLLGLLRSIAGARQWETVAAASPKVRRHHDDHIGWESAARRAVRDHGGAIPRLLADRDADLVRAAEELACLIF